jgi:putative membrane protein
MDYYNYLNPAPHLCNYMVCLFYIVRLFVYQIEAAKTIARKRFYKRSKIMTYRLWYYHMAFCYIGKFLRIGCFFTDLGKAWLQMPWMHVKLGFVFALYLYHGKCQQIFNQLQNDQIKYTTNFMRLWNEGATIILLRLLVILKMPLIDLRSYWNFIFALTIMLGFKFYKRIRESN